MYVLIMHYKAFISVSMFSHSIHYQNYFIDYYIGAVQFHSNFFDILLAFVFFLQTYYDICFFHIISFCFFLLQISFSIYLLLALLIFLYRFHNNLFLYLISLLCFLDNKFSQSFFIHSKKNYKTPFLSTKLQLFIMLIA